jgi:hypothetical protein
MLMPTLMGWRAVAVSDNGEELAVVIVGDDLEAEQIDELIQQLREELLELDVDSVERIPAGEAPTSTRAVEIFVLGGLLVKVAESVNALNSAIGTIRDWLSRRGGVKIEIRLGNDVLELSNASRKDEERLIAAFLDRHSGA